MSTTYDAVIVGSGPGGATLARELSLSGRKVLVLERGMDRRGSPLHGTYPGAIRATERGTFLFTRQGMQVIRPLGVGGATGMYCGSAAPPPRWLETRYGIDLAPWVDETVRDLGIAPLRPELRGAASTRLAEAASDLGMEWKPQPKLMDPGRRSDGDFPCGAHCMLGCRCGAKWNAGEYLDEAVALGCEVRTGTRVERVLVEDGRAVGVAATRRGRPVEGRGEVVVLAGGGLGTPRILMASGMEGAGRGLAMDSTLMVYGAGRERGIGDDPPMTYGWTDEERGFMLSTLIDPFLLYPIAMAGTGLRHVFTWPRWRRTLGVMIKIKDSVSGEIRPDGRIDKPLTEVDAERLKDGIKVAERILVRAGCDPGSILPTPLRGTHPSATVRIGELLSRDLESTIPGLYVCDASIFPEALDAPTVLTIVAFARRLADHLRSHAFQEPAP